MLSASCIWCSWTFGPAKPQAVLEAGADHREEHGLITYGWGNLGPSIQVTRSDVA